MTKFTNEQKAYIREIAEGRFSNEITEMLNERFGTDYSVNSIRNWKKDNGVRSNVHGSNSTRGRFEKGNKPAGILPVGSVVFRSGKKRKSYYYFIKTQEPDKWELYHKWIWEQQNEKLQDDEVLVFLDRNPKNCKIENLAKLTRRELLILNHKGGLSTDPEVSRAMVVQTKLERMMYDKGATRINHWNNGRRNRKSTGCGRTIN